MARESRSKIADAEYLTDLLHRSGRLGAASVRSVVVESSRPTLFSRIGRLRLEYDGAAGDAPASLILKTGLPASIGQAWDAGRREVAFYQLVAPAMGNGIVPICFDAHWDSETKDWHLLLEDLTDTHVTPSVWPLPPTLEHCETFVAVLARVHAAWWDDPRLGVTLGTRHDAATTDQYVRYLTARVARFADLLGDRLPRERLVLCERYLEAVPRLHERLLSHRNVTILHGDAHVWNCFMARDGGSDARLFDWDCWRLGIGPLDLAYMMAVHWYPDRRRRFEAGLLDHYHAALLAHGVRGYDRGMLDDDYRLGALLHIATPVRQAVDGVPPVIWWNNFERIMMAVDDLGCRELLG
jgi:hypothetical protein